MPAGLFGGFSARRGQRRATTPTVPPRVFFLAKTFNEGVEFLSSIGIAIDGQWQHLHNVGSAESLKEGTVYICPHADERSDYQEICRILYAGRFRVIIIDEVKTWEVQ